jgi:hypothetical protein
MFESATVTTTRDQKPALRELIRNLPGILSGRLPDVASVALGFRTRIGYAILSLIAPNFDELGRGNSGADGDKWKPLSKAYLAYGRRFGPTEQRDLRKQAGLSRQHSKAPGNKKGLLTPDQLKQWRKIYADRLAWYIMRESDDKAKAHAAAVAWIIMERRGAKTKLEVFGNRTVQILVDTGRGRGSLTAGTVSDFGPGAQYQKPAVKGGMQQEFDVTNPNQTVVGTNVGYMGAHHRGNKRLPRRRLWPENFPSDWWNQILGVAISGLVRIGELFHGNRL